MAQIGNRVYIDQWNYLQLIATESAPDLETATSLVTASLQLVVVPSGWVGSTGIKVGINGETLDLGHQNYYGGTHTLITTTINAPHYSDGNETLWISWWFSAYIGSWSGDGILNLTNIFPILNSGTDFTSSTNPTLNITAFNTYPLKVKLEVGEYNELITRTLNTKNSINYTFDLTYEERKRIEDLMTENTIVVRETVCALRNGEEISWSYKDYIMTVEDRGAKIRVNGQWKEAKPYIRVNGQWKEAKPYIRVNGQWKEGI